MKHRAISFLVGALLAVLLAGFIGFLSSGCSRQVESVAHADPIDHDTTGVYCEIANRNPMFRTWVCRYQDHTCYYFRQGISCVNSATDQ